MHPPRFLAPALYSLAAPNADDQQWLAAFTTAVAGWPGAEWGPTHLHRCAFWKETTRFSRAKGIHWRVETQLMGDATPRTPLRITEGQSRDLALALSASLATACRGPDEGSPSQLVTPAFVAAPVLLGTPRIWVCSAIYGSDEPRDDAISLAQTCVIRETRRGKMLDFACSLEGDALRREPTLYWHTNSLSAATSQCEAAMLQTATRWATTPSHLRPDRR